MIQYCLNVLHHKPYRFILSTAFLPEAVLINRQPLLQVNIYSEEAFLLKGMAAALFSCQVRKTLILPAAYLLLRNSLDFARFFATKSQRL